MAENNELQASIESLHAKIDRVLDILADMQSRAAFSASRRPPKQKAAPLTQDEISALETQFGSLYDRWLNGHEMEVQEELERLDGEQLRRLGDANNLNVTSKMPKDRVLHLIGARFREKKQLHKGAGSRKDQSE
jgi:hypothetical protein